MNYTANNYYDVDPQKGCLGSLISGIIAFIICLLISLTFGSCRTIKEYDRTNDSLKVSRTEYALLKDSINKYSVRVQQLIVDQQKRDSTYEHHTDSTFVYVKGDSTIIHHYQRDYVYKWSYEALEAINSLHDSISLYQAENAVYASRLDSIASHSSDKQTTIEKRYIPIWMKIITGAAALFMILIMVFIFLHFKD